VGGTLSRASDIPHFHGLIGTRITRDIGLIRAAWLMRHGHWLDAALAAGITITDDEARAIAAIPAHARPLVPHLPGATSVFIFEPFQADLVHADLRFLAGLPPDQAPAVDAPVEVRLLHAWHLLLRGETTTADTALRELGAPGRTATARMLLERRDVAAAKHQLAAALAETSPPDEHAGLLLAAILGNEQHFADAEDVLTTVLRAHPRSARGLAQLGLLRAKQGKLAEAAELFQKSLDVEYDPEIEAMLRAAQRGVP
jgi:hypothetical protein